VRILAIPSFVGTTLASSVNTGSYYGFVGKIVEDSPADRSGALHVGDRILSVNSVSVSHLHHEHIVNMIKESGLIVVLTVGPPGANIIGFLTVLTESLFAADPTWTGNCMMLYDRPSPFLIIIIIIYIYIYTYICLVFIDEWSMVYLSINLSLTQFKQVL